MRHIIFSAMLFFMLASCSQQANEYNQTMVDPLDTDSAKVEVAAGDTAKAVVDSTCGCVREDNSEEEFYEIRETCSFKIASPINGYENYREIDSIACYYNKWTYSPDAEYKVVTNDQHDPGGGYIKTEVYRNGKKVMEKYVDEGGEGKSERLTYYYVDGTVKHESPAYYRSSISITGGLYGPEESDYQLYEHCYGKKEQLFREIRCVTDKVVDGNLVLQVVRVASDRILPDTLTIGYQLLYSDYDRGYYNGEEYDVKSYFVVEEGKGEPVSDTVKLAAKRISSESHIDLDGLEFVEIGK